MRKCNARKKAERNAKRFLKKKNSKHIKKVKKGYSLCSCTPSYGYDRPKHQEVQTINPKEAEVVKRVFKMYSKGKTFTEICDVLNSEKISSSLNETYVVLENNVLDSLSNVTRALSSISDLNSSYSTLIFKAPDGISSKPNSAHSIKVRYPVLEYSLNSETIDFKPFSSNLYRSK